MNASLWLKTKLSSFPQCISSNERPQKSSYDVIVVGGGITGLSAAYYLTESGLKVCVLEKDKLASGQTGYTTAHLTAVPDLRLQSLAKGFGETTGKKVWNAGELAIDEIESIVDKLKIDCEFRRVPGYLHATLLHSHSTKQDVDRLHEDLAVAQRWNLNAHFDPEVPIVNRPGITFANQAKFNPTLYLKHLANYLSVKGCDIFEHSPVAQVDVNPLTVFCNGAKLRCSSLILATHVPLMGKLGVVSATLLQTKLALYSTYAIAARIPQGYYPEANLWDTDDPYFYLRIDRGENWDTAIFGGCDHKTGQVSHTEKKYAHLKRVLNRVLPDAEPFTQWSGQVIEPADGLPFIGETAKHQFVATGFSGNGMTFGTFSGLMIRDIVLGRKNEWKEIFDPHRKTVHAGGVWSYFKENLDFPIYFIKDYFRRPKKVRSLRKNEGKILTVNGKDVACFRDSRGQDHFLSATCTHLGCCVQWNHGEQTWDCPCHGSRFSTKGEVLAGPAERPLESVSVRTLQPKKMDLDRTA